MLDILVRSAGVHLGRLEVASIDHGVRPESSEDVAFVGRLAAKYQLQMHAMGLQETGATSEDALRKGRYACLTRLQVDAVALGHHRDDQAETVLLQLIRGTGLAGLRGMRWQRDRFVRPMLEVSREELENYAEERTLHWRVDETNHSAAFTRNRVRGELLPLLEDIRHGASAGIARSALKAQSDEAALRFFSDRESQDLMRGNECQIESLASLPGEVIRRIFLSRFPKSRSTHLDDLVRCVHRSSGRVVLPDNVVVIIHRGMLSIREEN